MRQLHRHFLHTGSYTGTFCMQAVTQALFACRQLHRHFCTQAVTQALLHTGSNTGTFAHRRVSTERRHFDSLLQFFVFGLQQRIDALPLRIKTCPACHPIDVEACCRSQVYALELKVTWPSESILVTVLFAVKYLFPPPNPPSPAHTHTHTHTHAHTCPNSHTQIHSYF